MYFDFKKISTMICNNNLLYFVADGTGAHIFSESYEEHLGNIKKIKKSKLD